MFLKLRSKQGSLGLDVATALIVTSVVVVSLFAVITASAKNNATNNEMVRQILSLENYIVELLEQPDWAELTSAEGITLRYELTSYNTERLVIDSPQGEFVVERRLGK